MAYFSAFRLGVTPGHEQQRVQYEYNEVDDQKRNDEAVGLGVGEADVVLGLASARRFQAGRNTAIGPKLIRELIEHERGHLVLHSLRYVGSRSVIVKDARDVDEIFGLQ